MRASLVLSAPSESRARLEKITSRESASVDKQPKRLLMGAEIRREKHKTLIDFSKLPARLWALTNRAYCFPTISSSSKSYSRTFRESDTSYIGNLKIREKL